MIPSLIGYVTSSSLTTQLGSYAPLASTAFTGTATLGGQTLATTNQIPSLTGYLQQSILHSPVYADPGRCIDLGCDYYQTAYINFQSSNVLFTGYTALYSARIVSSGGSITVTGLGVLNYYAISHISMILSK